MLFSSPMTMNIRLNQSEFHFYLKKIESQREDRLALACHIQYLNQWISIWLAWLRIFFSSFFLSYIVSLIEMSLRKEKKGKSEFDENIRWQVQFDALLLLTLCIWMIVKKEILNRKHELSRSCSDVVDENRQVFEIDSRHYYWNVRRSYCCSRHQHSDSIHSYEKSQSIPKRKKGNYHLSHSRINQTKDFEWMKRKRS